MSETSMPYMINASVIILLRLPLTDAKSDYYKIFEDISKISKIPQIM